MLRSGSKTRLSVCGKRAVSRAIGSVGRTGSVSVASTQDSSCRSSAGSSSSASRRPRILASRMGTGQSIRSASISPAGPRSISHIVLRWAASEKE